MTSHNIGVDISKDQLDLFDLEAGEHVRFDNTRQGLRKAGAWLKRRVVARVVYEPTGACHKLLETELGGSFPLVKVNPLQARRFAEASGTRAKTDAVDARMLARMGAALSLEAQDQPTAKERLLKELQVARSGLIAERTRLRNRAHVQSAAILKRQLATRLKLVAAQIGDIDKEIAKVTGSDAVTARRHDILCSIPGLGAVAAAAVAILLPEIGKLDRKQVASLAGLAPMTRSSGQWSGRSFITGGRQDLRVALYMPAIVAMRRNPDLRAKYEALRAAGKPAKVAIVAVMRKMIELANALVKADRMWAPKPA